MTCIEFLALEERFLETTNAELAAGRRHMAKCRACWKKLQNVERVPAQEWAAVDERIARFKVALRHDPELQL